MARKITKFVNTSGQKKKAKNVTAFKKQLKKGKVASYHKASTSNRCWTGFRAAKGSTKCNSQSHRHTKKDGTPDMRYKINRG